MNEIEKAVRAISKTTDGQILLRYLEDTYMNSRLYSNDAMEIARRAGQHDLVLDLKMMKGDFDE
jgi:hypothetical protein